MQTNTPLNIMPIQQFLSQVKTADSTRAKEIKMSIEQARSLALTLGQVMARLNGDLEQLLQKEYSKENEVIQIQMDGGSSW
jgi:5-bromo-4-chloroindolyl phosphate hydrolysis protein|tara:strand:- start:127 stop:369 length:243 start_codon:yes stop_codon:yes gene_type:complete